jgi:hypothetical protein
VVGQDWRRFQFKQAAVGGACVSVGEASPEFDGMGEEPGSCLFHPSAQGTAISALQAKVGDTWGIDGAIGGLFAIASLVPVYEDIGSCQ